MPSDLVKESGSPGIAGLTAHLGYWLRHVSNHVSHAFQRKLEGLGVTVAEWVVLRELFGEPDIAPGKLSEKLGLTRGAISKLVDRLEQKKLILRKADAHDARAQILKLSATGKNLVPKLAALADENEAEFFDCLSATDRKSLERILKSLVQKHGLKATPIS